MLMVDQIDTNQTVPFKIRYEMVVQTILLSIVMPVEAKLPITRFYQAYDGSV